MIFLLLVTVTSMALAAAMSVVAWRMSGDERRRSEARIAALAADIRATPLAPAPVPVGRADAGVPRRADIGLRGEPAHLASPARMGTTGRWHDDLELRPTAELSRAGLLAAAPPPKSGSQRAVVFGIVALAFGSAAALAILSAGPPPRVARDEGALSGASPAPLPLELVALGHERDRDRITVRGVVRNPATGTEIDGVAVVVFLFDHDGGFVASGRMPLQASALLPGGETAFVVTVPGGSDVGRYRVSFRTADRIVPHVDRRQAAQVKG